MAISSEALAGVGVGNGEREKAHADDQHCNVEHGDTCCSSSCNAETRNLDIKKRCESDGPEIKNS
jgi:hypothetical protein